MKESDHGHDLYEEMTEEQWIRNKKAILKRLEENNDSLMSYRDTLTAEKKALVQEVEELENEKYSLTYDFKELEIQHLKKNSMVQKLTVQLQKAKKKLLRPLTEQNNYLSEMMFLKSEKARLNTLYDHMTDMLNSNMANLGNIILEIDFMKGEIETLRNKIAMIEDEIPANIAEMDELDEKINQALKSLNNLYTRMQEVEKDAKIFYYDRK